MDKITKLPWEFDRFTDEIKDRDGKKIAYLETMSKENKKFLIRAVNSHKGLVEAANDARERLLHLFDLPLYDDQNAEVNSIIVKLSQALKKAADGEGVK